MQQKDYGVNLSDAITNADVMLAGSITREINANTGETTEIEIDGVEVTVGRIVFPFSGNYAYQMVALPNAEYNNFWRLAERMMALNSTTDMVTRLDLYREFLSEFNRLAPAATNANWITVQGNEILQPADAEDGDRYIVWLREGTTVDVQFMTSTVVPTEREVQEAITTRLPVTYENATLLIVLGGLVVAVIVLFIIVKRMKKREEK